MGKIQLYNSLTRQKEEFVPFEASIIKFYVCGPTVYDLAHLGHARSQIAFDVIRRYFEYSGYKVNYVSNYTDIDDKMITRANEEGIKVSELADKMIISFENDMKTLFVKPATVHPRATKEIPHMITFIEKLIAKGFAYESNGDIFFDVRKFENYGQLSGVSLDDERREAASADETLDISKKKKFWADFALWKAKKPNEPSWPCPWGKDKAGRPGWHIECSVMSSHYLGETIDIHGGGSDLKFPHHENEIAQSEALTGKTFVRYFMHNGFVIIDKEKMSKSLGNFFTIKELLKRYDGEVIRFFCAAVHYRAPIDFSFDVIDQAKVNLARMHDFLDLLRTNYDSAAPVISDSLVLSQNDEEALAAMKTGVENFEEGMNDDFNASKAVAAIFDVIRKVNPKLRQEPLHVAVVKHIYETFLSLGEVLGIFAGYQTIAKSVDSKLVKGLIQLLIEVREESRKQKNWTLADTIRTKMTELGVIIEDQKGRTLWKLK